MRYLNRLLIPIALTVLLTGKDYKGGELRTAASYTYGKFEVRMKSAPGSGLLSSFFTYHDVAGYWNEIDIEVMGRYSNEVQFNVISPGQVNHVYRKNITFVPHDAFHVYSIIWTPGYIAWYIDDEMAHIQVGTHISEINEDQKIMMNIWPPDNADWAGVWSDTVLPAYAYYDWVKYYSYHPDSVGTDNMFMLEWVDEFDTWDQSRWQKATHTFWGNNCDFIPQNVVFVDGYMVLCLTDNVNTGYDGGPITAVEDSGYLPQRLELISPYPNPFNNRVKLGFNLVVDQALVVRIYNLRGMLIKQLANQSFPAGRHSISWDGIDDLGREVSTGLYLVQYSGSDLIATQKILLMK